jgi:hypothetical protein
MRGGAGCMDDSFAFVRAHAARFDNVHTRNVTRCAASVHARARRVSCSAHLSEQRARVGATANSKRPCDASAEVRPDFT